MKYKSLHDVCDFINGLWTGKKPPYIKVNVIRNTNFHKSGNLDFENVAVLDVEIKQFNTRQLKFGDIILEKSGGGPNQPVGRVCLFEKKNEKFSLSNFTCSLRVKNENELNYKYLYYFLRYLYMSGETEKIQTNSTGIRNLQIKLYKDYKLFIAPLPIQQKIVARLDKIFAEIDKAIAATETNARNAKFFLNNFISEKLNNKNGKIVELKNIIEVLTDYHANGSYKVLKKNVEIKSDKNFAWMVRSTDFENNFKNNYRYIDKKAYEFLRKSKIFGGEILMCKIGNAGEVYLMPKISSPCSLAMNLFLIRVNENICITKFVYYFLISNNGKLQIFNKLKGATTKTITKENVKSLKILLVDLDSQMLFVKKIEEIEKITNDLIKNYNNKIDLFNILRNSILKQGFNGELIKAA
jgi:type I restriction enzyme S subunit